MFLASGVTLVHCCLFHHIVVVVYFCVMLKSLSVVIKAFFVTNGTQRKQRLIATKKAVSAINMISPPKGRGMQ